MTEQEIFAAAIRLDGDARTTFLDVACGQDRSLRIQVEALLQAHDDSGGLLPRQTGEDPGATRVDPEHAEPGKLIGGKYQLLEQIGEGGMGTVWLAEQREPVRRKVAIKLVKAGLDTAQVLARFEAERQALALMDHPNIAKVFDGGMTAQQRPYFVMEFVHGIPLTEYCDQNRLSVRERMELFVPVCRAVQHAHQKGIIHRDLKPSNILICQYDGIPVPKVIDFGLAKAMHQSLTAQTLHTSLGIMLGTPLYMSPEQAEQNNLDVDTRSDIYSLGVILYELLTGSTPLERQQLQEAAFNEVLRLIREVEPLKPSTRLSGSSTLPAVAAQRSIDPAELCSSVSGELDWIVMKALDKDRSRRYETANGLARDLERFLNDELVEASPPSISYRFRKVIRRHRAAIFTAGAFAALLIAGTGISTWQAIRASRAERDTRNALAAADEQRIRAEDHERIALDERKSAVDAAAREASQRALADQARDRMQQTLDAMTSSATDDSLSGQTHLTSEQKVFLNNVLTFYRELSESTAHNEQSRLRTARAAARVGAIQYRLGSLTEAAAAFEAAAVEFRSLTNDFPSNAAVRHELADVLTHLGQLSSVQGERQNATELLREAITVLEGLVEQSGQVPEFRQSLARSLNQLGLELRLQSQIAEAEAQHRRAVAILESGSAEFLSLAPSRQQLAKSRANLSILLDSQNLRAEAIAECRRAIDLFELLRTDVPDGVLIRQELAICRTNLAIMLNRSGHHDEAIEEHGRALAVREQLCGDFPGVPEYRLDLARSHNRLGYAFAGIGKAADATVQIEQAIEILRALVRRFPETVSYQQELAGSYTNFGVVALSGQPESAVEQLRNGNAILTALSESHPEDVEMLANLSVGQNDLGAILSMLGRDEESAAQHRQALAIRRDLVDRSPDVPVYQEYLGFSLSNLGDQLGRLGQLDEAAGHLLESIEIRRRLAEGPAAGPRYAAQLATSYLNLSDVRIRQGNAAEGLDWSEKAIALLTAENIDSRDPEAMTVLRSSRRSRIKAMLKLDRTDEAIAELTSLTPAADLQGMEWFDFAGLYALAAGKAPSDQQTSLSDRAMECLTTALDAGYQGAIEDNPDFDSLRTRPDFLELLDARRPAATP